MEATAAEVRDNFIPSRVTNLLAEAWERLFGLGSSAGDVETRRAAVEGAYQAAIPDPRGTRWQDEVERIIGGGWTYTENAAGFTVTITVPFGAGSVALNNLHARIREVTPAHLLIVILTSDGFILDESLMDQTPFHSA